MITQKFMASKAAWDDLMTQEQVFEIDMNERMKMTKEKYCKTCRGFFE